GRGQAQGPVTAEEGVLRQAHVAHGAVPVALLRHEGGGQGAPLTRPEMADRLAVDLDHLRSRSQGLAGEGGHELVLAVAGDAADAEDLATRHGEGDVLERSAELLVRGEAEALHRK